MAFKSLEQISFDSHDDYAEMGYKTSGGYNYYGYKQYRGTSWKIKRENASTHVCDWVYGESGWAAAWNDPTALSYAAPPDA